MIGRHISDQGASGQPAAAANLRHPSESRPDRGSLEAELDEALLGTFPASDAPSLTSAIISGGPPKRDRL